MSSEGILELTVRAKVVKRLEKSFRDLGLGKEFCY